VQGLKDYAFVTSLTSTLSSRMVNEARFNFGERRARSSQATGMQLRTILRAPRFIGRELFSPVIRTETRYEFTDNINIVAGNHNFKFGGDAAFVKLTRPRSN